MMRQGIKAAICFLAAVLLTFAGLDRWYGAAKENRGYSFLLEDPLSLDEALELAEQNQKALEKAKEEEASEEGIEFVLWGQQEGQILSEPDYGKRTEADILYCSGDANLLFAGQNLADGNGGGCFLDEETALKLFGTANAEGREVKLQEKTFRVKGILTGISSTMAISVTRQWITENTVQTNENSQDERSIDHIYVPKSCGKTAAEAGTLLRNSYGLNGQMMDMELLIGISGALLLFVPMGLYFTYAAWAFREIRRGTPIRTNRSSKGSRRKEAESLGLAAAQALLLAAVTWMACHFFLGILQIPADYLPTKWSDFSFWSSLFREKAENIRILLGGEKGAMEWKVLEQLGEAAILGALAFLLFLAGRIAFLKGKKTREEKTANRTS